MSILRLVYRSFRYDFWMQLVIFLGVVVASAVLCGALLIGDSMQGSLKSLTLDRLGSIDYIITGNHWFRESLVNEMGKNNPHLTAVPGILVSGGVQFDGQTAGISVIGCSDSFWNSFPHTNDKNRQTNDTNRRRSEEKTSSQDSLFSAEPSTWDRGSVVVNEALADLLNLSEKENKGVGETISVWVSRVEKIPADSSLGRREERVFRKRLRIQAVLPNQGIGRFSLRPNQQAEPLALIPLDVLQDRSYLDCPEKINTLLISTRETAKLELSQLFQPTLDDLGLVVDSQTDDETGVNRIHVKSSNMLFSRDQDRAIGDLLPTAQPMLVYLVETLEVKNEARESVTPYSLVAAIDSIHIAGQKIPIDKDAIILNDWTAQDLGVQVGDQVQLTYFEPESVYGQTKTRTSSFCVSHIVPMSGIANDSELIPDWEGISDSKSLANWNPPFPFDAKKIREKDEKYWEEHRTTPKAFIALETGRQLWGSRFGETTTFLLEHSAVTSQGTEQGLKQRGRIEEENQEQQVREVKAVHVPLPEDETVVSELLKRLDPAMFGLVLQPVKQQGLLASKGTTPFNVLFLAFSFFIIGAALTLLAMLFRLGLERRGIQIGTLLALGFSRKRLLQLLLTEGAVCTLGAALIGVPLGILYAQLMIEGLHTLWIDAIVVPFLKLHISILSLVIGFFSATILSVLVVYDTLRRFGRYSARELMNGGAEQMIPRRKRSQRTYRFVLLTFFILLLLLLIAGLVSSDQMVKAGLFFATGKIALILLLFLLYHGLTSMLDSDMGDFRIGNLFHFSVSNTGRNPGRSVLSVGLLSVTAFLVLAVGAFHLDSNSEKGNGGFSLVAETRLPLYFDLNTEEGRNKLHFSQENLDLFKDLYSKHEIDISSFRVRPGDKADCLNLYQPKNPRILGVQPVFARHDKFQFAQSAPFVENPWTLLNQAITQDPDGVRRVPIILDANTAMYSLHLYGGVGETFEFEDDRGKTVRGEVVALLANSLFQGDLLMSETNMLELFPHINGYGFFLIQNQPSLKTAECSDLEIEKALRESLGDFGLSVETTQERLARLYAVQNTYLATFSSLGGFGLFLGTLGIGIVQWRNVLQRRKELALFRALGFRSGRIIRMVLTENLFLLVLGTFFGAFAALLALIPQVSGTTGMSGWAIGEQFACICLGMLLIGIIANIAAIRVLLQIPLARSLANE
ncbi:MAG: ABC transporter permease [Thermoguttaceae bacterium]